MTDAELNREILQLLATHSGQPMDYVAVFMFLNTVAGGHYEERYGEDQIRRVLADMVAGGRVEAWQEERRLERVEPGVTAATFRLPR